MTTTERIAEIDSKIDDIVSNPQISYSIGNKSVSHKEYFIFLLESKKLLLQYQDVDISSIEFAGNTIDEMGNIR